MQRRARIKAVANLSTSRRSTNKSNTEGKFEKKGKFSNFLNLNTISTIYSIRINRTASNKIN